MASQPKLKKGIYWILLALLAAIFLFSAFMLLRNYWQRQQSKQVYSELSSLRGEVTRPAPTQSAAPQENTTPTEAKIPLTTVTNPNTGLSVEVLPELADIYVLNPDLVGWLTIPGTDVDHPVVQRKEEKDYYLHRNFYGNYDASGCLYAHEECDVAAPSDNVTIYGHHMYDLAMFGQLLSYQEEAFWQEHPYLYFDTLTERHTYQVICTFTLSTYEGFSYHLFVDAENEAAFEEFLTNCESRQLYDTGLTAQYGDKLLTLSTCEYTHASGRLVVVAKRID